MLVNMGIRRKHKHRFKLLDVRVQLFCHTAIRIANDDVFAMTLIKLVSFLAAINVKVKIIEVFEMRFSSCLVFLISAN